MQMKCLKEPEWNSLEIPPAFHCCPRISCYHHKEQQLPAGTAGLEGLRLGRGERQRHPGSPCSSGEQRLPQAGCSINLPHRGGFAAVCLVLGIQISSKLLNPFGRKREKKTFTGRSQMQIQPWDEFNLFSKTEVGPPDQSFHLDLLGGCPGPGLTVLGLSAW